MIRWDRCWPLGRFAAAAPWSLLFVAWLVALAATLGALFVGEVMGRPPCLLCWYQRIAMFPLALIIGIACFREDPGIWRYALPLALGGGVVAFWHSLLYFGVVSETIVPCGQGPSCTTSDMTVLGSFPLPMLSLGAFAAIALLLMLTKTKEHP